MFTSLQGSVGMWVRKIKEIVTDNEWSEMISFKMVLIALNLVERRHKNAGPNLSAGFL